MRSTDSTIRPTVPLTPGEAAALSAGWERRGPLGRLVRRDGSTAAEPLAAEHRRRIAA